MVGRNLGNAQKGVKCTCGAAGGPRGSTPTRGLAANGSNNDGQGTGVNRNLNLGGSHNGPVGANNAGGKVLQRQDSAVTQKANGLQQIGNASDVGSGPNREEIDRLNANRVGTAGTVITQGGSNNAANETKDAITGHIIHTVNMMKEVLQGNLGLRETIQKQSELIDN